MLQILGVTKKDEGAYRCVVSNSARMDVSREARLTVTTGGFFHSVSVFLDKRRAQFIPNLCSVPMSSFELTSFYCLSSLSRDIKTDTDLTVLLQLTGCFNA